MSLDFDHLPAREGTDSLKFDARGQVFGRQDVLPLWVADMDFPAPEAVTRALQKRAAHPVYGYSLFTDAMTQALIDWFARRHDWQIPPECVLPAPGVVPSLHVAALALTDPGAGIIVQTPVYPPFFAAVEKTGRRLLVNPLQETVTGYQMDFEQLEDCMRSGAQLMFLCSPHNPLGRVWSMQELQQLLDLAARYQVVILSDDIHCDLVYPDHRHAVLATLPGAQGRVITAVAPSKTFNIPGMGLSALIVEDAQQRQMLAQTFADMSMLQANPFSVAAFTAAYQHGDTWLDTVMAYLQANRDHLCAQINQRLSPIRVAVPQATYLLWLDCRGLGLSDAGLKAFFIHQAGIGLNPGISFGAAGSGFMRMNIATSRANLDIAITQIEQALKNRSG